MIEVDVGLSFHTCPKCGVTGAHFSAVVYHESLSKRAARAYETIDNASAFQCLSCKGCWRLRKGKGTKTLKIA
jgi:hypothetical protein